jgi:RNA polymerase sigma-54 factor
MPLKLQVQQKQKLKMTSELRQAIAVLQMPGGELEAYLREALVSNPVLELKPIVRRGADEDLNGRSMTSESRPEDEEPYDYHQSFSEGLQKESLKEVLRSQLAFITKDAAKKKIGEYIIENINDNGYLEMDHLIASEILHVSIESIEQMIQMIQNFEPAGVGARSLRECLLLQLSAKGQEDSISYRIIDQYLDLLGAKRYSKIEVALDITEDELEEAITVIRKLEPKPGRLYAGRRGNSYIRPDVMVEFEESEYKVVLNQVFTPRLTINEDYLDMLEQVKDEETHQYLVDKLQQAKEVIRSVNRRKDTLQKVSDMIVKVQGDFFNHGLSALKPLTLETIAKALEVHVSTVSRVVSGKYIQGPGGVYPMKLFFQRGFRTDNGLAVSAASIKQQIKELIALEDVKAPYSDLAISDILPMSIARRTVAKYRNQLGIPGQSKRRVK